MTWTDRQLDSDSSMWTILTLANSVSWYGDVLRRENIGDVLTMELQLMEKRGRKMNNNNMKKE